MLQYMRWRPSIRGPALPHASKLPERGFFADVDPKAEVYPVKSGLDNDVTKRGGRYQSDFIWNTNWKDKLDYEESLRKQQQEESSGQQQEQADSPGKLRLASKVDLNSMDVDLTAQLLPRKKPTEKAAAGAADSGSRRAANVTGRGGSRARSALSNPPTRLEQKAWERGSKFSRKVVAASPTNAADKEQQAAVVEAEERRYEELKAELQAWAAGLTAACLGITFVFYGRDVAASYGVGALGGLMYLHLLNQTMDSFGKGLGGALGQPRLLIPVILALAYNRYNTMVADETGLTLQLLPMLLGFFTYKGAVIAKQSLVLFGDLAAAGKGTETQQSAEEKAGASAEADNQAVDVASVDRAFAKRVLTQ
ncbi:hypothetical protein N2152v2_000154 [Parachlorella kessleri]